MTTTTDEAAAAPEVTLAAGEEASGFSNMIGDLLRDNVRDFKGRRRLARRAKGDVVLLASDRDMAITVSFRKGAVVIAEGRTEGAPVLAGPWLDMAKVCSGQLSPFGAMLRRRLSATRVLSHPVRIAMAGFVLSVPASYYGESHKARNIAIGVGAAASAAAVGGGIWWLAG